MCPLQAVWQVDNVKIRLTERSLVGFRTYGMEWTELCNFSFNNFAFLIKLLDVLNGDFTFLSTSIFSRVNLTFPITGYEKQIREDNIMGKVFLLPIVNRTSFIFNFIYSAKM